MTDYKIIQTINGPEDVKKLSMEQLEELASEIREALFNRLTKIGGHFGPNFGMVEAEIAMHYVFSSPKDKFIFDVSHQSYPHKILTGRKNGYISDEHFSEDSGYTNPEESEHDFFNVGHTSTSVSLATGLAKARDIKGDKENIIAIIGDGSLSGGEALEGLNVAGSEINSNLIIIVNDNEQSIAEVHGGKAKCRPFMFCFEQDGKLWFCTNNTKDVYKDMLANPEVEVSVSSPEYAWIRLHGKAVFEDNKSVKEGCMNNPIVKGQYQTADNPIFEVFYLENPHGLIADFSGNPPYEF